MRSVSMPEAPPLMRVVLAAGTVTPPRLTLAPGAKRFPMIVSVAPEDVLEDKKQGHLEQAAKKQVLACC